MLDYSQDREIHWLGSLALLLLSSACDPGLNIVRRANTILPSAVTLPQYVNSSKVLVSFSDEAGQTFVTHIVKACRSADCVTSCLSPIMTSKSSVELESLENDVPFYICVKGQNPNQAASDWVVSSGTVTVDTSAPTAPSTIHAANLSNGIELALSYQSGQDTYFDSNEVRACPSSDCASGCNPGTWTGTNSVSFQHLTHDWLYYICLRSVDLAGNTSNWAASSSPVMVDTQSPSPPRAISVPAFSLQSTVTVSFQEGQDQHFRTHRIKVCSANDCSTACSGTQESSVSPVAVGDLRENSNPAFVCIQTLDFGGNTSPWVASSNSVYVDTISPQSPNSVTVPAVTNSSFSIGFIPGIELNPANFRIKACINNDCSTGCVGAGTTFLPPGTIPTPGLSDGTAYYGCVQAVDAAGNSSNFIASSTPLIYDTTPPSGTIALLETVPGYSATQTPSLSLNADAGTTHYQLCTDAAGVSISCTGVLRPWSAYTTNPPAFNFASDGAKTLLVQYKDGANNIGATVASNTLVVDSLNPDAPSAVAVPPSTTATTVTATYTPGSDANFATHNVKACTQADCATGCLATTQDLSSPVTISSLTKGTSYYICLQSQDLAGLTSSWQHSAAPVAVTLERPTNVRAPSLSGSQYIIAFTPAADAEIVSYNFRACSSDTCTSGCVGSGHTPASPGSVGTDLFSPGTAYYGCAQSVSPGGHVSDWSASSGTITLNSGTLTFSGLIASALYPTHGADLLDFIADADSSKTIFHQTDTACTSTTGPYSSCIHGGEYRKLTADGVTSCTGLTITDALGWFTWVCQENNGAPVTIYSKGFANSKVGITDFIDTSVTPLALKANSVTVSGSGYAATSSSTIWWANTVRDVVAENLTGGNPNLLTANGKNDIFVIKNNATENGFRFGSDRTALVMTSGAAINYNGPISGSNSIVQMNFKKFTWLEGSVVATDDNGTSVTAHGYKVHIRNLTSRRSGWNNALSVNISLSGNGIKMENVRAIGGFRGFYSGASNVTADRLYTSHTKAGFTVFGAHNAISNSTFANAAAYEGVWCRAANLRLSHVLIAGVRRGINDGLGCTGSVFSNITVLGSWQLGGVLDSQGNNTWQNILVTNNNDANFMIEKSSQTNPSTFVNIASSNAGVHDVTVSSSGASWTFDTRYLGVIATGGQCSLSGSPVLPGIDATCTPNGNSTATNVGGIDPTNLYKGPLGIDDPVNTSDNNGALSQIFDSSTSLASLDLVNFDTPFRAWSQNMTSTVSSLGPWTGNGSTGKIFDYRLKSTADNKVFQHNPNFVHGTNCPAQISGTQTGSNAQNQIFLLHATEILLDRIGNDDGLCETGEACLYTPNIGAYQGDGDYTTKSCVFQANGGLTGITIYAYPSNGI